MNVGGLSGGKVRRGRVPRAAEGVEEFIRLGIGGEQYTMGLFPGKQTLADEGSTFVATNPTPGTALAAPVNATYDVIKSFIVIKNNASITEGKRVYLDMLKLIPTVAPASATAAHYAVWLGNMSGYTSGGSEIIPVNVNGDDSNSPVSRVILTATTICTTVAAGLTRLVDRGVLRSVIPAVGDEMVISFGSDSAGSSSSTAAGRSVVSAPSIIIPPQGICAINIWFPSNAVTGMSYEAALTLFER